MSSQGQPVDTGVVPPPPNPGANPEYSTPVAQAAGTGLPEPFLRRPFLPQAQVPASTTTKRPVPLPTSAVGLGRGTPASSVFTMPAGSFEVPTSLADQTPEPATPDNSRPPPAEGGLDDGASVVPDAADPAMSWMQRVWATHDTGDTAMQALQGGACGTLANDTIIMTLVVLLPVVTFAPSFALWNKTPTSSLPVFVTTFKVLMPELYYTEQK